VGVGERLEGAGGELRGDGGGGEGGVFCKGEAVGEEEGGRGEGGMRGADDAGDAGVGDGCAKGVGGDVGRDGGVAELVCQEGVKGEVL